MIPKSRYDTIDCYLASSEYNDQEVVYDQQVFQHLKDEGLDALLAQHVAHLFIRDPISLFAEKLEQDVETEMDHFEVSGWRPLFCWYMYNTCTLMYLLEHPVDKLAEHEV